MFFFGTDHGSLFPSHASHGEGRSQSSRFDGHDTLACGARTGASDSAQWVGWVGEYLEDLGGLRESYWFENIRVPLEDLGGLLGLEYLA